jgi:hypothetical protein
VTAGLLLAGLSFASARADDTPPPKDWIAYGIVMTKGPMAEGEPPKELAHPDLARIVAGRYRDKDGRDSPPVVISHDKGRILFQLGDLPAMEVLFAGRPASPPRGRPILVFVPDDAGRLLLSGFIVGDVGGELVLVP